MDLSKEELKKLMKASVTEALEEFFANKKPAQKPKQPSYQEVFDDVMAKVARGELTSDEAGRIIKQAYEQQQVVEEDPSYNKLSEKIEEFKTYLNSWEKELDIWADKGESSVEMMERMKSKVQKKEEEAKLYADMKKIEEIEAKSKAEASLAEMKSKLKDK